MKNFVALCILLFALSSCEKDTSNFVLTGEIAGLKKGTLYLQQKVDSSFIIIDSAIVSGKPKFTISTDLKEPEVLYLRLNKNDDDDGLLRFFADQGTTNITTSLDQFLFDAKINGSKQQKTLEEYQLMMSKFNNRNLDLIKESFDKRSSLDSTDTYNLNDQFDQLLKRKYLYTINFAFSNKDSEVAPFLAVAEIPDARIKFLDTIYGALTNRIKDSKYGKELKNLIEARETENIKTTN